MTERDETHSELFYCEAKLFMDDLGKALKRDKSVIIHCKEVLENVIGYLVEKDADSRLKYSVENCLRRINEDVLYRKKCRKCAEYVTDRMHRLCDKCLSE